MTRYSFRVPIAPAGCGSKSSKRTSLQILTIDSRYAIAMRRIMMAALLLLVCGFTLTAQQTHPASGRTIAPVMGMGGADWLVRSEREMEEAPDKALDAIVLKKGDTVADIGAG